MSVTLESEATAWRTSDDYASRVRRVSMVITSLGLALGGAYAAAIVVGGGDPVLLVPLIGTLVGLAICTRPVVGVYLLFGAALLFEQFEIIGIAPITTQTRIFQNLSTYTPIPIRLSIADLLVLMTLASWAWRLMARKHVRLQSGPFGWAVIAYGAVFVLGVVIGAARGGEWNLDVALNELRGPILMCLLYFLTTNLIRNRRQAFILMWEFVALVGIKGLQGVQNYLEQPGSSLRAYTGDEDVVFFAVAIGLMAAMAVLGLLRTRLSYVLLALQPLFVAGVLLAQRRAGVIAVGTVLLVITVLAVARDPRRGIFLAATLAIALGTYVVLFSEQSGPLGEPIRALRTVVEPDSLSLRDQGSNSWREIENHNITYTIKKLPLTGVGLGQKYLFDLATPVPQGQFAYWQYITHNAVLWVWLKAGPLGAFALWLLVARVILLGSRMYVRQRDPEASLLAFLPVAVVVSLIVFSIVDLGLTYSRTMIATGTLLGLAALLPETGPPSPASGLDRKE